jgi:TonB family protein
MEFVRRTMENTEVPMFRKRVVTLSGVCGLLLLFILQAISSLSQTNTGGSELEEETRVNGLPIRAVKRTLETQPTYTEEARLAAVEGTAVVYAEITKDGSPENLRVLRSLGFGLDQEAIRTVQQWRFEPNLQNGQVTRVATYVPVRFRLDRQMYGTQLPSQGGNEVFQIGDGVTAPRVISPVGATYTDEARTAKLDGKIVLFVEITSAGVVENVVVLQKMGKGMDESAVRAIKQWKFSPATKDGRPVAGVMTVEMNFSMG